MKLSSQGKYELIPKVPKEFMLVISVSLFFSPESSWGMGEVPQEWRWANVPIFKKRVEKEEP